MITQNDMPTSEYDPGATLYEIICTHRRLQWSRKNETQSSRDRYEVADRISRYNLPSYTTTEMWHHWEKLIRFDKIAEKRIYPLGRRTHWKKTRGNWTYPRHNLFDLIFQTEVHAWDFVHRKYKYPICTEGGRWCNTCQLIMTSMRLCCHDRLHFVIAKS